MPTSSTPIPDAAVEALLESKVGRLEEGLNRLNDKSRAALRDMHRDGCRADLQAAYPAILDDLRKRLLGDEAVEAATRRQFELNGPEDAHPGAWLGISESIRQAHRAKVRCMLEAALSEVMG